MTVLDAVSQGYAIGRDAGGIYLDTPFSDRLRCPSWRVAWLTLFRVATCN